MLRGRAHWVADSLPLFLSGTWVKMVLSLGNFTHTLKCAWVPFCIQHSQVSCLSMDCPFYAYTLQQKTWAF